MKMHQHPFETIDWNTIEKIKYPGETGYSLWQTIMMSDIRIRIVEYSAGYFANHWCNKGHVIFCVEGAMEENLS